MIRDLALSLMTHNRAISEHSWGLLRELLIKESPTANNDIINAVHATDGQFYLPEEFD